MHGLRCSRVRVEFKSDNRPCLLLRHDALEQSVGGQISISTTDGAYGAVALKLGLAVDTVVVKVHRLRPHYGELIRAEIAKTVETPADVNEKLRHLFSSVGP
jgi:hypothetical protein